jgi:hypothetical protein
MRRHVHRAQLVDEVLCIEGFVGAKRDRCRPVGTRFDQVQRGHPFGMPVGLRQARVDQQAVAVLHQPMAPSTARQQQVAFRSDLVLTLFAHLLAFSF